MNRWCICPALVEVGKPIRVEKAYENPSEELVPLTKELAWGWVWGGMEGNEARKKKKTALLSMKSWLFKRDPSNGFL